MSHRLSLTEFVVIIVLLFALAQGAAAIYQRFLVSVATVTAERMNQR